MPIIVSINCDGDFPLVVSSPQLGIIVDMITYNFMEKAVIIPGETPPRCPRCGGDHWIEGPFKQDCGANWLQINVDLPRVMVNLNRSAAEQGENDDLGICQIALDEFRVLIDMTTSNDNLVHVRAKRAALLDRRKSSPYVHRDLLERMPEVDDNVHQITFEQKSGNETNDMTLTVKYSCFKIHSDVLFEVVGFFVDPFGEAADTVDLVGPGVDMSLADDRGSSFSVLLTDSLLCSWRTSKQWIRVLAWNRIVAS